MLAVLIIALGLVAAAGLAFAAAYALGYDTRPLQASASEAAERTSDLAAEFFEWLRTGR